MKRLNDTTRGSRKPVKSEIHDVSRIVPNTHHENRALIDICVASDRQTLNEIRSLRKVAYKDIYPEMDLDKDILDDSAINAYTRNKNGEINSTARFAVAPTNQLPEARYLASYRKKRLIEWGRFVIAQENKSLLRAYYRFVYTLASNLKCDAVVMALKPKDISIHVRLMGARVVRKDMEVTYGGPYSLACVVWDIARTTTRFFSWAGVER